MQDTTGRIENLYAHVRKIENEYMEANDNEEYSDSEDDAASDMSDSDAESVEDKEDHEPSHSESSSCSQKRTLVLFIIVASPLANCRHPGTRSKFSNPPKKTDPERIQLRNIYHSTTI